MASFASTHQVSYETNPVDPLQINKVKGQINIKGVLRDSKGDEYARIEGRSWEISNPIGIEYNNDATALEIRTGQRVIFQLEIIKDTIFCYGMLCSELGNCMFLDSSSLSGVPKPKDAPQRFFLPSNLLLPSIFKYPRSEYLGVRDTCTPQFRSTMNLYMLQMIKQQFLDNKL